MAFWLRLIALFVIATMANMASASFHTFQIEQIYSDATGTVQFLVLHEVSGLSGQNFLAGHVLTSTQPSTAAKSFTFPSNLPNQSTAGKRMLIASQGFAALGIVTPDYVIPNGFIPLANGTINYASADIVSYAALPTDGTHALNRNSQPVANVATNYAGRSASVVPAVPINYEGLWWNAPADSESGWGINLAHQGDVIFATWFTYDLTGKAWWLSMTANKTADGVYAGTLFQTTGPAFDAMPFDPAQVVATSVGSATLTFSDANNGSFAYTVNGVSQTKALTRQVFGALPTCTFGAQSNLALASNYQDLWWAAPAASESGWGINLTQQGDTIFATWFTYDHDRTPLWLSATATKTAANAFGGTLYRTSGPTFNAFDPTKVVLTSVGTLTLTFGDGNTGTFAYTVNNVSQSRAITRQVFRDPGTVCQ
jgi:hypothetical protein